MVSILRLSAHRVDKRWITFLKKDSEKVAYIAETPYICYVIKKKGYENRRQNSMDYDGVGNATKITEKTISVCKKNGEII